MMKEYIYCLVMLFIMANVSAQEGPHIALNEELLTPLGVGSVDVSFNNGTDVVGFQFTLNWQPDKVSFDSIGGINLLGLTLNEFGLTDTENGQLSVLWFDNTLSGAAIDDTEQVIFRIHFTALPGVMDTNAIGFVTTPTPPLVVTLDAAGNVAEFVPDLTDGALILPQELMIDEVFFTNVSCFSSADADVEITATGGYPPYTYLLEDEMNSEGVFANKAAGVYQVTVVDSEGGMMSTMITITEPEALAINTLMVTPACEGENTGAVDVLVEGGSPPYNYLWSNSSNEPDLVDITSGTYELSVTDTNNCTESIFVTVDNVALIDTFILQQPSCFGFADGEAEVELIDAGYAVSWSNGESGNTTTSLMSGDHNVVVSDGAGCSQSIFFNLEDGPQIDPNISIIYGCGDGSITVLTNPQQGQPPFDIAWSTGDFGLAVVNFVAGEYTVNVTDAAGCQGAQDFTVDYVTPLVVTQSVEPVSCTGAMDGDITIEVTGGIPPYSYLWNTGENTENLSNLAGGQYTVNISANDCGVTESIVVEESLPINIDVFFTPGAQELLNAQAIVTGGIPPYLINWSTGEQGGNIENVPYNTDLEIVVEDANGCEESIIINANLTNVTSFSQAGSELSVYPNPSNGIFKLDFPFGNYENIQLRVYHVNGTLVKHQRISSLFSVIPLDLTTSPAGLYWLELMKSNGNYERKLIVLTH